MSSSDILGSIFFICLAFFLVSVSWLTYKNSIHENETLARMVEAGHSPISAKCAFDSYGDNPTCVLVASGKTPEVSEED